MTWNGDIPPSWSVDRLVLENVRCFSSFELSLSPVTVLVGRNGSGKTAVLDSIAAALTPVVRAFDGFGPMLQESDAHRRAEDLASSRSVATVEAMYPVVVEATCTIADAHLRWSIKKGASRGSSATRGPAHLRKHLESVTDRARDWEGDDPLLPIIAYYGVERLIGSGRGSSRGVASRLDAYTDALKPRSDLTRLYDYFEALSRQIADAHAFQDDPPKAATAQLSAIQAACDMVLEPTGWGRPRWNPVVDELTLTHGREGTLPLRWLSTGTKVAAGLAFDLASRMARANPRLGGTELLERTPGIVLIDEIDLHLHPAWQQQMLPLLRKAFPSVQFIVTTHSPQVISTVEAGSVRIIEGHTARTPAHAEGLRSDVVLREVQGTDPVPEVPIRKELNEYLELVFRGDGASPQARQKRGEIESKLGGIGTLDELADADAFMALAELEL